MQTNTTTKPKLDLSLISIKQPPPCPTCLNGQLFPDDDDKDLLYCLQCGFRIPKEDLKL